MRFLPANRCEWRGVCRMGRGSWGGSVCLTFPATTLPSLMFWSSYTAAKPPLPRRRPRSHIVDCPPALPPSEGISVTISGTSCGDRTHNHTRTRKQPTPMSAKEHSGTERDAPERPPEEGQRHHRRSLKETHAQSTFDEGKTFSHTYAPH